MRESSGEKEMKPPRGTGSWDGSSASSRTVSNSPMKGLKDRARERKTISGAVFRQPMTTLLGPIRSARSSRLRVAENVRRLGDPPDAGML